LRTLIALACCLAGGAGTREDIVTREPPPPVAVGAVVPGPRSGFYVIGNSDPSRYGFEGGTLLVMRYDRSGRPVPSFGHRGIYKTRWPGRPVRALGALRQRDGKLVVVGSIGRESEHDMFVARLFPDGTLDGAFGSGGIQTLNLSQGLEEATAVAIQPDGRLVIAGWTNTERRFNDPLPEMVLARLRQDGGFDEGFGDRGVVRFPPRGECVRTTAFPTRPCRRLCWTGTPAASTSEGRAGTTCTGGTACGPAPSGRT
jgi:uncharacterized delta-60 repeat protein